MTAQPQPLTDVDEAAYREAVARWHDNPNPADARVVMRGAAQVLRMLDAARAEVERLHDERSNLEAAFREQGDALMECLNDHKAQQRRASTAEAERDRLAEQVKRASDLDLIRLAISDPSAFVKRERLHDDEYETVPAWGARAVVAALSKTEAVATDA